ncbi:hypothetical protein B0H19DRAFT_1279610 [Mycena capillaripes]|nr:hypothetical protein B0H19DRAFT_1279610 [Mycena capillaripes]
MNSKEEARFPDLRLRKRTIGPPRRKPRKKRKRKKGQREISIEEFAIITRPRIERANAPQCRQVVELSRSKAVLRASWERVVAVVPTREAQGGTHAVMNRDSLRQIIHPKKEIISYLTPALSPLSIHIHYTPPSIARPRYTYVAPKTKIHWGFSVTLTQTNPNPNQPPLSGTLPITLYVFALRVMGGGMRSLGLSCQRVKDRIRTREGVKGARRKGREGSGRMEATRQEREMKARNGKEGRERRNGKQKGRAEWNGKETVRRSRRHLRASRVLGIPLPTAPPAPATAPVLQTTRGNAQATRRRQKEVEEDEGRRKAG